MVPSSWNEAIIFIIRKEGKDRLFASIISRRLETILPLLKHKDQTIFIKPRQTQDSIRRVLHVMQYAIQKTKDLGDEFRCWKGFWLLSIQRLKSKLNKFDFHKSTIEIIADLHNKPVATIKFNGDLTETIALERGVKQIICLHSLFALYIYHLVNGSHKDKISIAGKEQKLALFADDLLLTISDPTQTLSKTIQMFDDYGTFSGYKKTANKTQVLTLYYNPPQNIRDHFKWKWGAESILLQRFHKDVWC